MKNKILIRAFRDLSEECTNRCDVEDTLPTAITLKKIYCNKVHGQLYNSIHGIFMRFVLLTPLPLICASFAKSFNLNFLIASVRVRKIVDSWGHLSGRYLGVI